MHGVKDLVENLAKKDGISKKEAERRIESVMSVIFDAIEDGGVQFRGKLTLEKAIRKGRKGKVNGYEYNSKDTYYVKAKTGKELKAALNK